MGRGAGEEVENKEGGGREGGIAGKLRRERWSFWNVQKHTANFGDLVNDQNSKLYEEDEELQNQIRQFLINNFLDLHAKIDEEALLAELPLSLKEEVLYRQFGGLVETIKVLRDSTDNEFVWAVVQIANKIAFEKDDTIYW